MKRIRRNKAFIKPATILIKYLFYFVWGIAFLMSITEAIIYPGVFMTNLNVSVYPVYGVVFFLLVLFKVLNFNERYTNSYLAFSFGKLLSLLSVIGYLFFSIMELLIYPNYVFSTFHLHPNALIWPLGLSTALLIVGYREQRLIAPLGRSKKIEEIHDYFKELHYISFVIFIALIIMFFVNTSTNLKNFLSDFKFMIRNPSISMEERLRKKVTPIFYDYVVFVNKYVPEDAKILIPPQGFPWPQSGNYGYIRYFIYPREGTSGKEYEPGIDYKSKGISYVLLSWGETESTEYGYTHGWPKFDVPAEWVVFYDESGRIFTKDGDYHYKDFVNKKVWGVIKIKT
ncbi:MAG TPA: hypothetical protein VJ481_00360 [Patescibacteria group bacterium]|uniref:Uncharacterized protein n=1 Tax=Candidatus Woesebacteria bacterium RBG_13_46_13 TaxID=1802479 RepID=A0A1F7X511_9BACT|nr:MAG: hypothetical protein A2Y68_00230 [Candidatus Woesebacteria bacterium RBG_13_46_13]HJX58995.1 hypothetical protein [Patescibacteria group bacterium]